MGGATFSGSSARRAEMAKQTAQQAEIDKQKALAETAQASALQDTLQTETNRMLRIYGARALQTSAR